MNIKFTELHEKKIYQIMVEIDTLLMECVQDLSIPIQSEKYKDSILQAYNLSQKKIGRYCYKNIISTTTKEIMFLNKLACSSIDSNDTDSVFKKFKEITTLYSPKYFSNQLFLYYVTKVEKFGENIKYRRLFTFEFIVKYLDYLNENMKDSNITMLVAIFSLDLSKYVNRELNRIQKVKLINLLSSLLEKSKNHPEYYKFENALIHVVQKHPTNKSAVFLLGTFYYHQKETNLSINYYSLSCKSDDLFHEYQDSKRLYFLLFQKKKYDRILDLSSTNHVSYLGNQEPYYLMYRIFALQEKQDMESAFQQIEMYIRNHYFNNRFINNHAQSPLLFGGIIFMYLAQKYEVQFIDFLPVSHKEYKTIEALYDYLEYFNDTYSTNPHFYLLKAKTYEVLGRYQEAKTAAFEGNKIDSSIEMFFFLLMIYESRLNGCAV
jgi:hypothetical protein